MEADTGHCSICLRPWTSTGGHQVCCLRCGHLYGHDCILTWLNRASRCPECNARAHVEDIRMLYADKVTAADDSQLESMRLQLLDAQSSRIAAQSSAKHMRKCSHKARQQAAKLRAQFVADRKSKRFRYWCGLLTGTMLSAATVLMLHKFDRFRRRYEEAPDQNISRPLPDGPNLAEVHTIYCLLQKGGMVKYNFEEVGVEQRQRGDNAASGPA